MKHRFLDGMIGGMIILVLAFFMMSLTGSVQAWTRNNQVVGSQDLSIRGSMLFEGQPPQLEGEIQAVTDTSISYQGQLKVNNLPYSGSCDMQFNLWDTYDIYLLNTTTPSVVQVNHGLFSTTVDFGSTAFFSGRLRQIEPLVRCPSGVGDFTSLGKQDVSAVPYAIGLVPGAIIAGSNLDKTLEVTNHSNVNGNAILGSSTNGTGILGVSTNGSGLAAGNYFSGTALEILAGNIKVDGAGLGTNTPVFIHQVPATNPCSNKYMTRIDNTIISGQPGAILLVTYHDWGGEPVRSPVGVFYDNSGAWCGATGRWVIYGLSATPVDMIAGQKFNVLAVLP